MTKPATFLFLGVMLSAALSACDSKTSANKDNFGNAVTQYFEKKGDLCLDPIKWPVDVYDIDMRQRKLYPDGVAGQMTALESIGLAKGEDQEVPGSASNVKVKFRRYTMQDAAKPFLHARPGKLARICWARKSLDKVIRWADPAKVGDHDETSVLYTYKLSNVAPWARKPEVKEAFPEVGRHVDGEHTQKEKLYVKLTPQGWEALGLND